MLRTDSRPEPPSSPRRVLFFTTTLGGGGAESHALRVMNHLDRSRWLPTLAVAKAGGSYEAFLREDVRRVAVSWDRVPSSTGRIALSLVGLRRVIDEEQPHLVCSVMDPPSLVAAATLTTIRRRPRHIVCVQVPPLMDAPRSRFGRYVVLPGIKRLYPRADRIIALSHGVRDELTQIDQRLGESTVVIHNACVDERLQEFSPRDEDGVPRTTRPVIIAAGRLQPEKAFEDLIDAFAILRRRSDAELWILGEGPARASLEERARASGVGGWVKLLGFQKNPHAFMRRATVFALSSLYEGFGNVIVESLACGTPVVATDCPYGPKEILGNEIGGLLVPVRDPAAMANALERVLTDGALRERLRSSGLRRSEAFRASAIAAAYAAEFDRVCG